MRLLITGGGTGGHVYPLLAVLQKLVAGRALDLSTEVRYVGRGGSIEERLAAGAGIAFTPIDVRGMRTLAPWTLARNLGLMASAERKAAAVIRDFKPTALLATGGYVSAPVIYAAAQQGVPVVIYLPDLEPGWAIRTMARWARCVAVSFEQVVSHFAQGKAVVTGYPVREEFYQATRAKGRAQLGLGDGKVVTIFGGSTGAHSINQAVQANLPVLLELAEVVHISGRQDETMMQAAAEALAPPLKARYHHYAYMDAEMPLALAAADLAVARAGAATLGEFPAVGVPSVLVPYPFAGKHQDKNANFLVERNAASKLDDADLGSKLVPLIESLLRDRERLASLATGARALARPDAADNIARLL